MKPRYTDYGFTAFSKRELREIEFCSDSEAYEYDADEELEVSVEKEPDTA